MANISSPLDWLRAGMGGHNVEVNAVLYHTLDISLRLAAAVGDHNQDSTWTSAMDSIKAAVNAKLWDPSKNLFFDNDTTTGLHPQDGNSWAIISELVTRERAAAISTSLQSRWVRPYGALAPEAGDCVSPFVSGLEVQTHFMAGFPERAIDLMEFMWADFMLDDPRKTNSTFIEGYSTNGELHYPPYENDARVSHAHGWATGPTSSLTFHMVGLRVNSAAGKTWIVQSQLGTSKRAEGGYVTPLGGFSATWAKGDDDVVTGSFETPSGTSGTLLLRKTTANVKVEGAEGVATPTTSGDWMRFDNLPGGTYKVSIGLI